jgi:hypothetical protein
MAKKKKKQAVRMRVVVERINRKLAALRPCALGGLVVFERKLIRKRIGEGRAPPERVGPNSPDISARKPSLVVRPVRRSKICPGLHF